jgi:prepilin-type N-terminal cleavage/methylation domain-containing protein
MGRHQNRRGFTMVEVLVSLLIMALMLTSITRMLTTVRTTRDHIHNTQETMLAGPAIVDLIERDLMGLSILDRPHHQLISIRNRVELGLDADRIDFVTTTDGKEWEVFDQRAVRADMNEVGYVARPNPEYDEFLELFRREDLGIDDEPFEGGRYTFLHDRVLGIEIEAYDEEGIDAEPFEDWGNQEGDEETSGLPVWVKISVTLELAPRLLREQLVRTNPGDRVVTYTRIVRFPKTLRIAQENTPRVAIPVPSEAAGGTNDPVQGGLPGGAAGGGRGGLGGLDGPLPGEVDIRSGGQGSGRKDG